MLAELTAWQTHLGYPWIRPSIGVVLKTTLCKFVSKCLVSLRLTLVDQLMQNRRISHQYSRGFTIWRRKHLGRGHEVVRSTMPCEFLLNLLIV